MANDLTVLVGLTFNKVIQVDGDEIHFICANGDTYKLFHWGDCCESVCIESVTGDLTDLEGTPMLIAEESTSTELQAGQPPIGVDDSFTWTFYKFATIKGYVDIRWFGSSNGYYSERVDFIGPEHKRGRSSRWTKSPA